jgi:hypothetical protein
MDKLQLTGQNLCRMINYRSDCVYAMQLPCFEMKLTNLKRDAQKLTAENLEVVWAKFSLLSQAVLLHCSTSA